MKLISFAACFAALFIFSNSFAQQVNEQPSTPPSQPNEVPKPVEAKPFPSEAQRDIVAFGPNGEMVTVFNNGQYMVQNVSNKLSASLQQFIRVENQAILDVEFTPSGGWVIIAQRGFQSEGVGPRFDEAITQIAQSGNLPVDVTFFPMNWTDKRAFAITTNKGWVIMEGVEEILTGRKSGSNQTILTADGIRRAKMVQYAFTFDELFVKDAADGEATPDVLEIYGQGKIELFIHNKLTRKIEKVNNAVGQLNSEGKLVPANSLVIPKANAVNIKQNSFFSLKNTPYVIEINPEQYGYDNAEELEVNSFLQVEVALKEADVATPDDAFETQKQDIRFADAKKVQRTEEEVVTAFSGTDPVDNSIKFVEGDNIILLTYSLNKIEKQ